MHPYSQLLRDWAGRSGWGWGRFSGGGGMGSVDRCNTSSPRKQRSVIEARTQPFCPALPTRQAAAGYAERLIFICTSVAHPLPRYRAKGSFPIAGMTRLPPCFRSRVASGAGMTRIGEVAARHWLAWPEKFQSRLAILLLWLVSHSHTTSTRQPRARSLATRARRVAGNISGEFWGPVGCVGFGEPRVAAAFLWDANAKSSRERNDFPARAKNEIRFSGQVAAMQPVAIAEGGDDAADLGPRAIAERSTTITACGEAR